MAAGATYEPIATTTLSSAASSITFSSIASSWTDLRLVLVAFDGATDSTTANLLMRFNSDSGTNYSSTRLVGDGSSATSGALTNSTVIPLTWTSPPNDNTTTPAFSTADIFSYAGSTYKTALVTTSNDQNGSGAVERFVGLWRNTTAISTITISCAVNMKAGTTATLYGIKAA